MYVANYLATSTITADVLARVMVLVSKKNRKRKYVFAGNASSEELFKTQNAHSAVLGEVPLQTLSTIPITSSDCREKDGFVKTSIKDLVKNKVNSVAVNILDTIDFLWNGTTLDVTQVYCLPKVFTQHIINRVTNATGMLCNAYTGYEIIAYNKGNVTTSCMCKYPDIFTGLTCNKQVACGIRQADDTVVYSRLLDRKTNETVDPLDFLIGKRPASSLREIYTDGRPRFVCDCRNGYPSLRLTHVIHPLQCMPDPCFPTLNALPHDAAPGLDWDMRCQCGNGDVTRLRAMGLRQSHCIPIKPHSVLHDKNKAAEYIVNNTNCLPVRMLAGDGPFIFPEEHYAHAKSDGHFYAEADPCDFCEKLKTSLKTLTGYGVEGTIGDFELANFYNLPITKDTICTRTASARGVCSVTRMRDYKYSELHRKPFTCTMAISSEMDNRMKFYAAQFKSIVYSEFEELRRDPPLPFKNRWYWIDYQFMRFQMGLPNFSGGVIMQRV